MLFCSSPSHSSRLGEIFGKDERHSSHPIKPTAFLSDRLAEGHPSSSVRARFISPTSTSKDSEFYHMAADLLSPLTLPRSHSRELAWCRLETPRLHKVK
ncbi:unnamed protein product [Protopolystoma xenopodis]|uniref:Uncharacterized protein n=1 Tax=Protopolystoma xenopodis TaxID=117903 RepID=A0A448X6G3_9PLAT|nr:unnamed protein product [Protopolystoma xenopodis]